MLLAWTLPEMDEFGRSNGLPVKGYKVREVIISNRGFFLSQSRGALKSDGTLFQVFGIASQTVINLGEIQSKRPPNFIIKDGA